MIGCHTWFYKDRTTKSLEDMPAHDVFRIGNYPEDELLSYQETIDYINNTDCYIGDYINGITYIANNIPQEVLTKLQKFWKDYPNGLIEFG